MRCQMVTFCSLLQRHYDARQGVAEHPASPYGDKRNAHRPPHVAKFLHIQLKQLCAIERQAPGGLLGPSKPRTVEIRTPLLPHLPHPPIS